MFWAYLVQAGLHAMGLMTFRGRYVKRHYEDPDTGLIHILFHDGPPMDVPYYEWKAERKMVFRNTGKRSKITRGAALCC